MVTRVVELNGVSKSFYKEVILRNFDLTINSGEMIAITGPSGSGKTTILNIIGLLEKEDNGTVRLFEEKKPSYHSKQALVLRKNKIAYLFQNYALMDEETVSKNLDIPLELMKGTRADKKILKEKALRRVGIINKLNNKIHSLSGGEQQRVAIARLLLRPCELLLADEPTGSLDTANRNVILDLLCQLRQEGMTIVIVTHDSEVAERCDRVITLRGNQQ
ncbi:putative bacteriocin export ABC transporter [Shouchella miscanthi]|uniref:Bacteriocin export ABC transporter n=1 Tax=Shouchella miscanthi TaxID=2598861 RepID=A0ABU6NJC1_9BACI|nr:putative bacteriocin export ABC transporter [Shouchella miscanthi]MED4128101.1 putative bacteriocin export ABC transporter [Shouchella miscanthi]